MTKPSLSIVVVVRNAEDTVAQTIYRLMDFGGELETSFDVLLIDNGSADDTIVHASDLSRQYPQIQVYYHPAGDETEFIQIAMRRTQGRYVMVCEGAATLSEIRELWRLRTAEDFVMASVFAGQTVVRTTKSDEIILMDKPSKINARLIARQQVANRCDQAHAVENKSSPAVYLRTLRSHAQSSNDQITQPFSV